MASESVKESIVSIIKDLGTVFMSPLDSLA